MFSDQCCVAVINNGVFHGESKTGTKMAVSVDKVDEVDTVPGCQKMKLLKYFFDLHENH